MIFITIILILFMNNEIVFQPYQVISLKLSLNNNKYSKQNFKLFSSKIDWSNIKITNNDDNKNKNDSSQFISLKDFSNPNIINVEDLQAKWIDICIENSKPEDLNKFSLRKIIPMISIGDQLVEVVNRTLDRIQSIDTSYTYVTEQELKKLWLLSSTSTTSNIMRNSKQQPMDQFNVLDSLLLFDDEDDEELIYDENDGSNDIVSVLADNTKTDIEETDGIEFVVTLQELQRLWKDRAEIPWGLPNKDFDMKQALLLLDPDDDYEEDEYLLKSLTSSSSTTLDSSSSSSEEEEVTAKVIDKKTKSKKTSTAKTKKSSNTDTDENTINTLIDNSIDDTLVSTTATTTASIEEESSSESTLDMFSSISKLEYVPAKQLLELPENEKLGFWNRYKGRSNQLLRDTLKRMYDKLEQTENMRTAWKKDRIFMSPDIDTQEFMGDIMFSNTYLTQRIPANWDDPETDEMSDTYLSTSTMAWPGEEETNFNLKTEIWDDLKLPFGPKMGNTYGEGLLKSLNIPSNEDNIDNNHSNLLEPLTDGVNSNSIESEVDWNTFDFDSTSTSSTKSSPDDEVNLSIDNFFDSFNTKNPNTTATNEISKADKAKQKLSLGMDEDDSNYEDLSDEENAQRRRELLHQKALQSANFSNLLSPPWVTPIEWLQAPEYKDHVSIDVWSNYKNKGYEEIDDLYWDEDIYYAQSLHHLKLVTDVYLDDHKKAITLQDSQKYWDRHFANTFLTNQPPVPMKEPIPIYLTPDINRGINYSDEFIEMKGKLTLHPEFIDPEIAYKNDKFEHSVDSIAMNKIGTIREQYNWQPDTNYIHEIEEHKLEKLQPLLAYINHAGELLSTKDNVIIFQYRGLMRHLIGIRSSMLTIAKKCYPELVDLRLETDKKADKFDF